MNRKFKIEPIELLLEKCSISTGLPREGSTIITTRRRPLMSPPVFARYTLNKAQTQRTLVTYPPC